ncbi:MAG: GMC family oxidoreductase, partial [Oricola sp.]
DIDRWLKGGATGWDGYPDTRCGKMDAETCGLAAALAHDNVELVTDARVTGLKTGPDGRRVAEVVYEKDGGTHRITPRMVALCAGAVQSAALLLGSGLANRSDQVGRCFMNHNASALIAFDPRFRNDSVYQKTFGINDWYFSDGEGGPPLGNIQLLGRVVPDILQANVKYLPKPLAGYISGHAVDLYAISEDIPNPESRIVLSGSDIRLVWRRSNMVAHNRLVGKIRETLRAADFPVVLSRLFDGRLPSHQCGTVRIGSDPAKSAIDPDCRAWDHPNLFVADAASLPTSAAVNPALTVAAMALRAANTIRKELAA